MRLQKKGVAKMFAHLKVRTKLIILTAAISMLVMGIINMNGMNQSYKQSVSSIKDLLYDDYDTQIKGQVENVITLLEEEYENFQNGLITEDEAKKAAADIVRVTVTPVISGLTPMTGTISSCQAAKPKAQTA